MNLIRLLLVGEILDPRKDEESTKCKLLHDDELGNPYYVGGNITEVTVGSTRRLLWGYKKRIPTCGKETSCERRRWEINIKMDLNGRSCEKLKRMKLAVVCRDILVLAVLGLWYIMYGVYY